MKIRFTYIMLALLPLSACSQAQSVTPTLGNHGPESTNVVITISKQLQNEKGRSLQYFSINTQSIAITMDSGVHQVLNIGVNSSNCSTINSGGSLSCSFPVNTTIGTHTFTIVAYSELNGQGSALSTNTTAPITVTAGGTTTVPLSLNAIVASVAINVPSPDISGVAAQIPVNVILKDATGAIIVGASSLQNPITLVSSDPVHAQLSKTILNSVADEAGISIKYDGLATLPITISATGSGLDTNSIQEPTSTYSTFYYSADDEMSASIYPDAGTSLNPSTYVHHIDPPSDASSPDPNLNNLNYAFSKALQVSAPHDGMILNSPLVASTTTNAMISEYSGSYEEKASSNAIISNGHFDQSTLSGWFKATRADTIKTQSTGQQNEQYIFPAYNIELHLKNVQCNTNITAFNNIVNSSLSTPDIVFSITVTTDEYSGRTSSGSINLACSPEGVMEFTSWNDKTVLYYNGQTIMQGHPGATSPQIVANGSIISLPVYIDHPAGSSYSIITDIATSYRAGSFVYYDISNTMLNQKLSADHFASSNYDNETLNVEWRLVPPT